VSALRRVAVLLGAAVLLALAGTAGAGAAEAAASRPVWAHRGGTGSGHVENTRPTFRAAAGQGQLRWETDVRFTRTDYPVLLHDADLGKFGCPELAIRSVSVTRARECVADDGQTLSTLSQFTHDLTAYGARAWVELKTVPTADQWSRLERRLQPVQAEVVVESFLPSALEAASGRGYTTALLTTTPVARGDLPHGTDWYAPKVTQVTGTKARAMHAVGVQVAVWTPSRDEWSTVPGAVDELISNDLP